MSKSLLKKALALAEEELSAKLSDSKNDKKSGKKSTKVLPEKKLNLDIMPNHHKMIKFVGKKGHKEAKEVLRRPEGMNVIEARKRLKIRTDYTQDNIRKLLLLSSADIADDASAMIIKRAQTGRYVLKADDVLTKGAEDNSTSVFDEADFEMFEKELSSI